MPTWNFLSKSLFIESVISTIDNQSTNNLGVRNIINASMTLHAGSFIGQILPYPVIIRVMEDE